MHCNLHSCACVPSVCDTAWCSWRQLAASWFESWPPCHRGPSLTPDLAQPLSASALSAPIHVPLPASTLRPAELLILQLSVLLLLLVQLRHCRRRPHANASCGRYCIVRPCPPAPMAAPPAAPRAVDGRSLDGTHLHIPACHVMCRSCWLESWSPTFRVDCMHALLCIATERLAGL
jgi:hypothetical protein